MLSVMYIAEYLSFIFTTPLNLELDALFIQIKCQDKIITKAKCKLPHTSTNFELGRDYQDVRDDHGAVGCG